MSSPLDRWARLWSRLSRRRLRREVDDELGFHLEMLTRRYESRGLDSTAAREAARERFGDLPRIRRQAYRAERSRIQQQKRALYMDNLRQDLRFTFRQLWKRPAFSIIALAMLALGIGANTAIFSVVYSILLKPLPFPEPDRLVRVWESRLDRGWERASVAPGNFWDFQEMNRSFEAMGAFRWSSANLTGQEYPELLSVGRVSTGFFGEVLGVRPVLGRTFHPDEGRPDGDNRVALLSHRFWRTRYGSHPGILGTQLTLDGDNYTVVGVLPPGRPWLDDSRLFLPMVHTPNQTRTSFEIAVVGRLKEGMTLESGRNDLGAVARRLEEAYPDDLEGIGVAVGPSSEWVASDETRTALWVLLGAVGFLLMIACVNLANLFLARATGRTRETAIRAATGASRGRLIRQGLTESLATSLLGAGLGLGIAVWSVDAITALAPAGQIPGLADVSINGWILLFTLAAGVVTGVVTGLVPAVHGSGKDAATTLRSGGRGVSGNRTQQRIRSGLVAVEVALSLMLLVGAGLLVRSFGELMDAERGFETENRLVASVPWTDDVSPREAYQFITRLVERISSLPPVVSAAGVHIRPLAQGSTGLGFARPGQPDPEGGVPWASWRLITPGYFETVGVPILRGRDFNADDLAALEGGALPTIISQRIAEELWPGEDPLGKTITLWAGQSDSPGEIVGVVGDMRERGIEEGPTYATYLPFASPGWAPELVIHTTGDPTAVVPAVRSILREMDPEVPLSDIATLDQMLGQSVGSQRFMMVLVSLFAGVALLLALAGVYGVQSYSVAQQVPEIGVRVAMGASGTQVLRRITLQAMRPAVLGVVVGLGGAFALSRFMEALLFQVGTADPVTYAGVAGALVAAALVSAAIPARKAARVDPVTAFRAE